MTSQQRGIGWSQTTLPWLWAITRVAVMVLAFSTVATMGARHHWLADLLANLRIQQIIATSAVLLLCVAYRRWPWTAVMGICLAMHVCWLLPARSPSALTPGSAKPLTVTVANVLTRNQRHDQIIADVIRRDPDVFAILELSSSLATAMDRAVRSAYPYSILRPMDDGNFGIGLYSRHPIVESEVVSLNTEIESIDATIKVQDAEYHIFATHPLPPMGARGYRSRNEHLKQLAARIRESKTDSADKPVILVGDLNLTPWSPHFGAFEQASGLRRASTGLGVIPTWYRYPGFPFGLVLDHALVSSDLSCVDHFVGPDIGSDHRSVTVTLLSAGQ